MSKVFMYLNECVWLFKMTKIFALADCVSAYTLLRFGLFNSKKQNVLTWIYRDTFVWKIMSEKNIHISVKLEKLESAPSLRCILNGSIRTQFTNLYSESEPKVSDNIYKVLKAEGV